jgi:hypothetical protein
VQPKRYLRKNEESKQGGTALQDGGN